MTSITTSSTELQFHPAANLFPMLSAADLEKLAQDIKTHGQREPVVIHDALVLDGRNRVKACQSIGVKPLTITKTLAEIGGSPTQYVLSTNLHRRHLTPVQAAAVAAEALPLFEEEARKRQDEGRRAGGGDRKSEAAKSVEVQNAPKAILSPPKQNEDNRARNQAAAATGAGQRATASMVSIKTNAPEVFQAVKDGKIDSVSDATKVAALEPEQRAVIISRLSPKDKAIDTLKGCNSSAKEIKAALVELAGEKAVVESAKIIRKENPHVSNNSGENEWYTPPHIIEPARACMGGIDFDPASSDLANKTVKAAKYCTIENSGLKQPWHGRVWLNPPYSVDLIGPFTEAAASKFENREYKKAVVLVNNATDTAWFHRLMQVATAVCFLKGRIRFMDKDGALRLTPLQGQMLVFIGCEQPDIIDHFGSLGTILWL